MAYTPDSDDAAAPANAVIAGTAAAEFKALKTKCNNLFLKSGYQSTLLFQSLQTGIGNFALSIPIGVEGTAASEEIAYGVGYNITRNDVVGDGARVVGMQMNAVLGGACDGLDPADWVDSHGVLHHGKQCAVFGVALEGWTNAGIDLLTGAPYASSAHIIAFETAVISQNPNDNDMVSQAGDFVFKNRPDVNNGPGLNTKYGAVGGNYHNANSRAFQISAQPRSALGEYCGWGRGILFQTDWHDMYYDILEGGFKRATGIDFRHMRDPEVGISDPHTAYDGAFKKGMGAAIALKEYQQISFDGFQFLRMYCDSINNTMWFLSKGTDPANTGCVGYDYSNSYLRLLVATGGTVGAAGAAAALPALPLGYMRIKLNGTVVKIPYYTDA